MPAEIRWRALGGEETIWAAVGVLRAWVKKYGIPVALYTDWKNVYVREASSKEQIQGVVPVTQFGRMCQRLGIRVIAAQQPRFRKGTVILNADAEINLKLNTTRFDGALSAWAQHSVRVLVPQASQTPFQASVNRPQDFVCRTDFCSKVTQEKNGGLYVFTYVGDGSTPPELVHLRSEQATVLIDTVPAGAIH